MPADLALRWGGIVRPHQNGRKHTHSFTYCMRSLLTLIGNDWIALVERCKFLCNFAKFPVQFCKFPVQIALSQYFTKTLVMCNIWHRSLSEKSPVKSILAVYLTTIGTLLAFRYDDSWWPFLSGIVGSSLFFCNTLSISQN